LDPRVRVRWIALVVGLGQQVEEYTRTTEPEKWELVPQRSELVVAGVVVVVCR
jgi:hypothetical protein